MKNKLLWRRVVRATFFGRRWCLDACTIATLSLKSQMSGKPQGLHVSPMLGMHMQGKSVTKGKASQAAGSGC
jgi:hypothetical protein